MRTRNIKNASEIIKDNNHFAFNEPFDKKGRWSDEFGNDNPLEIEIGSGKGKFIIETAEKKTGVNFIGMEKFDSILVRCVQKNIDRVLPNLRLIRADALGITDLFASREVNNIYINFPDPWPKNKHEHRRLTHPQFIERYRKILKYGGEIIFKTDNRSLFEYSLLSLSECKLILKDISLDLHSSEYPENVMTEYEKFFHEKGQPE